MNKVRFEMEKFSLVLLLLSCFEFISAGQAHSQNQLEDGILKQIVGVSRLQCSHRCARDEHCKHTAYQEQGRTCTLLNDTRDAGEDIGKDNSGIEKVDEEGAKFFMKSKQKVFSPHRIVESK